MMAMFYVLRPTQALLQWLEEQQIPWWVWSVQPRVWSQMGEDDHVYPGQEENAQTFLKLAILAHFQWELECAIRSGMTEPVDYYAVTRRVLTGLLGPPPLTVEVFDRWWSLERADGMNSVESTLAHTPVATLRKVRGPEKVSPAVMAHSCTRRCNRPVGEWWRDAIEEREEHLPCLQLAVTWILARLAEMTPHRTCAIRTQALSLDAPVEEVLHVSGWTLQGRPYMLHEGIRLRLHEYDRYSNAWIFTYQVVEGERRPVSKGTASLQLEKKEDGWTVRSGTLEP
ncbi:hypothetical protein [Pyxidicoccus sp. MSG2]|uniref:hypothetical protein n=1 Tax=Pyxidicoccus sp. MSG2 TaxID=2996790 RepID=UPI00226FF4BC|nr:hypothetical protein [Pyxidicoccus sp. MSG2]MCY1018570.1 hypothetical protein [Pyxidicoccus sp. MSG2]